MYKLEQDYTLQNPTIDMKDIVGDKYLDLGFFGYAAEKVFGDYAYYGWQWLAHSLSNERLPKPLPPILYGNYRYAYSVLEYMIGAIRTNKRCDGDMPINMDVTRDTFKLPNFAHVGSHILGSYNRLRVPSMNNLVKTVEAIYAGVDIRMFVSVGSNFCRNDDTLVDRVKTRRDPFEASAIDFIPIFDKAWVVPFGEFHTDNKRMMRGSLTYYKYTSEELQLVREVLEVMRKEPLIGSDVYLIDPKRLPILGNPINSDVNRDIVYNINEDVKHLNTMCTKRQVGRHAYLYDPQVKKDLKAARGW